MSIESDGIYTYEKVSAIYVHSQHVHCLFLHGNMNTYRKKDREYLAAGIKYGGL